MKKILLVIVFLCFMGSLFHGLEYIEVQEVVIKNRRTRQEKILSEKEKNKLLELISTADNGRVGKALCNYEIIIKNNDEIFVYFTNGVSFIQDGTVLYYDFQENINDLLQGV